MPANGRRDLTGRLKVNVMNEQTKLRACNWDPKCDYLHNYKFKLQKCIRTFSMLT